MLKKLCLAVLVLALSACGPKAPLNLTPEAKVAYTADKVVVVIGTLQHTAIELNKAIVCDPQPCHPILSVENTRVVVDASTDALTTLKVAPGGWKLTADTAVTRIEQRLDDQGKYELAAYIQAVQTVLKQLGGL